MQDTMRPRDSYCGRVGVGYRELGGGNGVRDVDRSRALPPRLPQDPTVNPRGVEAIVKLRGLPFEAAPRDVTDWINKAVSQKEVFLSKPVRLTIACMCF